MPYVARRGSSDQNWTKEQTAWLWLYSGGDTTDGPKIPRPVISTAGTEKTSVMGTFLHLNFIYQSLWIITFPFLAILIYRTGKTRYQSRYQQCHSDS